MDGQSEPPTPPSGSRGGKFKIAIEQNEKNNNKPYEDLTVGKIDIEQKTDKPTQPTIDPVKQLEDNIQATEIQIAVTPKRATNLKTATEKLKTAPDLEQSKIALQEVNAATDELMNASLTKDYNLGIEGQEFKYSKWTELQKQRNEGTLNVAQQREYRDMVLKAQADLNQPYFNRISLLKSEADFDSYWQGLSAIENAPELKEIEKFSVIAEQNGGQLPPEEFAKYSAVKSQLDAKIETLRQKTGVTPELEQKYREDSSEITETRQIKSGLDKQFNELYVDETEEQSQSANRKKIAKSLSDSPQLPVKAVGGAMELLMGFGNTAIEGVGGILKLPRAFGSQEYGLLDEWASKVESQLMQFEDMGRIPTMEGEKLPFYIQGGRILGEAAGSMATMMTGGVATGTLAKVMGSEAAMVNLASRTGTWATTYMMQLDDNLQEGLDAGLGYADAARNAHVNSALSATVEMIVPEGLQVRASYKQLIKEGMKPALAAQKVVQDAMGSSLKEGAEEFTEQLVGDVARTIEDPRYQVFDPTSYKESVIGGMLLGGAMNVFGKNRPSTPQVEQFKRDIAENPAAVLSNIVLESNTQELLDAEKAGNQAEVERIGNLGKILQELKQSEQFTALDVVKQNHVLAIQDQITSLENLENPTQQESDNVKNLSKQRETLLLLEAQGINPAYIGIETVPAKVNTEQGEANLFVNNQGDYEVDYGNGRSVIVESGDNAPRELSELGLRASDGEFVGGMPMNRNEVLSPVIEQGTQVNYQGKPARIQRVTEKNGNIVSATLATEDGNAIQVTEGQKGDAEEFLNNLNATNKQEVKNVLDVKGRGQDGSLILNPLSREEVKIKKALGEHILSDKDVDKMIEEGKIIEDCPPKGKIKAEHGLSTGFVAGGKWTIVQEFKGKSHEQGGIDIEVSGGNVKYTDKEGKFKAKNGGFFNVLGDIGKFMVDRGLGELAPNVIKNDSYDTKFFGNLSSRWEGFDSQSPLAKLSSAIRKDEEGEGMTLEQQELYNKSVGIAKPITGVVEGVLGTAMPVLGAGFAGINAVNKNDGIQQPIPTMGAQQISTQDAMAAQAQNAFGQQQGQTMNTSTLPQNIVNVNGMNYQYNQLTGTFDIMQ